MQHPEATKLAAARLVQEGVDEDVEQPARRVEPGRHAARIAQKKARAAQACRRSALQQYCFQLFTGVYSSRSKV